jgi:hypothetical protein
MFRLAFTSTQQENEKSLEASVKNDQTSLGQGKNASYRTTSNYFED